MEVGVWAALRPAIAVALGAIAGALGRYYISLACLRWWGATFPWATVVVNLVGAGAMGWWIGRMQLHPSSFSPELRLLVAVGAWARSPRFLPMRWIRSICWAIAVGGRPWVTGSAAPRWG
jgi:hypothetical protein